MWLSQQIAPYSQSSHCTPLAFQHVGNSGCIPLYFRGQMSNDTFVTDTASECFPDGFYDISKAYPVETFRSQPIADLERLCQIP